MYVVIIETKTVKLTASWSSSNAFASGARGMKFESRAGETEHTVADGYPPLRLYFEELCCPREMGYVNSLRASA